MTWKNYSTDHCDQTVTDMMIRFVDFGSPYQRQQKVWSFVGRYHHMENHGQWPGKITPSTTLTKQWQIQWFGLRSLVTSIKSYLWDGHLWVIMITEAFLLAHLENQGQRPGKITPPTTVTKWWQIWWFGLQNLVAYIKVNLTMVICWSLSSCAWKIMVNDLEKLLPRALWPNGKGFYDSVRGVW